MKQKQNPSNRSAHSRDSADDIFILAYDGPHKEYCQELISKSNERFEWTGGYIPHRNTGLVEYFGILQRAALTTIANDPQLRSCNIWPLSPLQSNQAIKSGNIPLPDQFSEDLAFVLYDTYSGEHSYNIREAVALKESIQSNLNFLNLSINDIEKRLLVVNAGLENDSKMTHGVKPVIIPGVSQVVPHKTLNDDSEHFINKYDDFHGLDVLRRERTDAPLQRGIYLDYNREPSYMVKINPDWSENVCYLGKMSSKK